MAHAYKIQCTFSAGDLERRTNARSEGIVSFFKVKNWPRSGNEELLAGVNLEVMSSISEPSLRGMGVKQYYPAETSKKRIINWYGISQVQRNEKFNPVDWIKGSAGNSLKVNGYKRHLKKAVEAEMFWI